VFSLSFYPHLQIETGNGSALVFSKAIESENAVAWFLLQMVISIADVTLSESSSGTLEETIFFRIGGLGISIEIVFFLPTSLAYASLNATVFVFLCAVILNASEFVFFAVGFRASQICCDGVGDDPDFPICCDGVGDDPDFPICFVVYLIHVADLLFSWILEIFCLPLQTAHQ